MIARTLATAFADGRLHRYRHSAQRSSTWPVSTLAPIEGRDGSVASRIVLRLFHIFRTCLDVGPKGSDELGCASVSCRSAKMSPATKGRQTWRCTMSKKTEFENQHCF